jgi:hypothetical protein
MLEQEHCGKVKEMLKEVLKLGEGLQLAWMSAGKAIWWKVGLLTIVGLVYWQ